VEAEEIKQQYVGIQRYIKKENSKTYKNE
jgi:hypothetical protein